MRTVKISQLPQAKRLRGSELILVSQGSTNRTVTVDELCEYVLRSQIKRLKVKGKPAAPKAG